MEFIILEEEKKHSKISDLIVIAALQNHSKIIAWDCECNVFRSFLRLLLSTESKN